MYLTLGEHQPVANGNDGATNQVTAEVHVDPPVPTPQRGPQSQMGPATGTITGVGSAVSHTTGVNGTGSAVSHITGIGSAVSNTTGIGVGSAVSHITGVNGTGSVDSHITGVGSAVSHITGVNGAGSVLSHITGIDETASVKSTDTGVGIAPPHQPSLPLDVSVSPSVRVMGKPRASPGNYVRIKIFRLFIQPVQLVAMQALLPHIKEKLERGSLGMQLAVS